MSENKIIDLVQSLLYGSWALGGLRVVDLYRVGGLGRACLKRGLRIEGLGSYRQGSFLELDGRSLLGNKCHLLKSHGRLLGARCMGRKVRELLARRNTYKILLKNEIFETIFLRNFA